MPKKRSLEELIEYEIIEKDFKKEWLDIKYEPFSLDSSNGYNLMGRMYYNKQQTNKTILSLHGHNSCFVSQLKYLNMFLSFGFNVFIPDHRRSGFSDGKSITFGHYEKYDLIQWMDYLDEKLGAQKYIVFGESMGAATAIMATALDHRILALIEYCGFYDMKGALIGNVKKDALLSFIYPSILIMSRLLTRTKFSECAAGEYMKKVSVPTLIMHSKADKVVVYENALKHAKANPNARFYSFEDSIHARSMVAYPEIFRSQIESFLNDNHFI